MTGKHEWWRSRREELLGLARKQSPLYVYAAEAVTDAISVLKTLEAVDRVFYAMKANAHPDILRMLYDAGLGFECVSTGEIDHVQIHFPGIDPDRILFTPNFAPRDEYLYAFNTGAHVTLDNLYPLDKWPGIFQNRELLIRLDTGEGHGHHEYVKTAGRQSKFGVAASELDRLAELVRALNVRVVGLHSHVGSGIFRPETWVETANTLAGACKRFPGVRVLNIGGGLGVAQRYGEDELDLGAVASSLDAFKKTHLFYKLWMEPGRFLVARAGVLLTRVTQIKEKGDYTYIGVDTGMNSFIRPSLYGSFHEILNLSRIDAPRAVVADIVGPICESGDVLCRAQRLPETEDGDVLLITTTGAYGRVMGSSYNMRPPADEFFLEPA